MHWTLADRLAFQVPFILTQVSQYLFQVSGLSLEAFLSFAHTRRRRFEPFKMMGLGRLLAATACVAQLASAFAPAFAPLSARNLRLSVSP